MAGTLGCYLSFSGAESALQRTPAPRSRCPRVRSVQPLRGGSEGRVQGCIDPFSQLALTSRVQKPFSSLPL